MDLRTRARDAATGASEATDRVVDRASETGAVIADEAGDLRERASDAVEAASGRVADEDGLPPVAPRVPDPAPSDAAEVVAGVETLLDDLDARYTASSAVEGAGLGAAAGAPGTAVGAGAGAAYGVYSSTRSDFDPEDPAGPVGNRVDAGRLLQGFRHARTGYRYGGVFGARGRVAGAALGMGVEALPVELSTAVRTLGDRATDAAPVDRDRLPDVGDVLAERFGDRLQAAWQVAAREEVGWLAVVARDVEFAAARDAATTSLAAVGRIPAEPTVAGKADAGRDALAGAVRLSRIVVDATP